MSDIICFGLLMLLIGGVRKGQTGQKEIFVSLFFLSEVAGAWEWQHGRESLVCIMLIGEADNVSQVSVSICV